jgi:hypothetical protein
MVRLHLAAFLALMAIGTARSASSSQDGPCHPSAADPCVFSPDANPYGKSYSDWAAEWWQWVLAQPGGSNPLNDTTGANCMQGQFGKVWFLAGTLNGNAVSRTCAVPAGKALLFPVVNAAYISSKSDSPQQLTLEFLRTQASSGVAGASNLTTTIDGVSVPDIMQQYREKSTPFSKVLPEGNIFGISQLFSLGLGVDEGWYLVVKPLAAGSHTIHFTGSVSASKVDVTYDITIASSNEWDTTDDQGDLPVITPSAVDGVMVNRTSLPLA